MVFTKILLAFFSVTLFALTFAAVGRRDACRQAFNRCDFQIKGGGLQEFSVPATPDRAFTGDIVSKNRRLRIGVVNTNLEGEFVNDDGSAVLFSRKIPRPTQPFTPNVFKAFFPSRGGMFSGIGHETFQKGQERFAKGMCVRVFLTEWQLLDRFGRVIGNVNNQKFRGRNCVVFRTRR